MTEGFVRTRQNHQWVVQQKGVNLPTDNIIILDLWILILFASLSWCHFCRQINVVLCVQSNQPWKRRDNCLLERDWVHSCSCTGTAALFPWHWIAYTAVRLRAADRTGTGSATELVVSANKASAATLLLLPASSVDKVSWRLLNIVWTLLWRSSCCNHPYRSAFLLLIGKSSVLVAAITRAFISGFITLLRQKVKNSFSSWDSQRSSFLLPLSFLQLPS